MNKTEYIQSICAKTGATKKQVATFVDAALSTIQEAVANGEKVAFVGFGTFEGRDRAARRCVNPKTKEMMTTEAKKVPAFKAGKAFKDAVNK